MRFEVLDHLLFGLRDEAEAGAVAGEAGERADRERTRVPERGEQAGVAVRARARAARTRPGGPSRRGPHPAATARIAGFAGRQGLAVVEGLGGDLPGVVDPHQRGRVAAGRRVLAPTPGRSRPGWAGPRRWPRPRYGAPGRTPGSGGRRGPGGAVFGVMDTLYCGPGVRRLAPGLVGMGHAQTGRGGGVARPLLPRARPPLCNG